METTSAGEKVKKREVYLVGLSPLKTNNSAQLRTRGKTKYSSKIVCARSKWANEQTLKQS